LPPLLLLFSFVNLVIGSAAFVNTGLLEPMAASVGVSVAAVGQTTTVYAVSVALLAPLLLASLGRLPQRGALALAMGLYTAGNVLTAVAQDLATLLGARVLMGLGSVATPLMAGIAVMMIPPERRARGLALVFLGVSLSYVVGLPLGAWAGLGWGWRVPTWAAAALTAVSGLALWLAVPRDTPSAAGPALAGFARLLRDRAALAVFSLTFTYFIAIFVVFAYIGPVLTDIVPMDRNTLSLAISAFGVAAVAGTLLGGRLTDRRGPRATLTFGLSGLVICLLLLPLTARHPAWMMGIMMAWGMTGFSMMAAQQTRLALIAGPQTALALSLNTSMIYLGTAAGGALGGLALTVLEPQYLPWVGAPFGLLALVWMRWSLPAAGGPGRGG
jgi:DHA1 family inner membrane transport protein